MNIRGTLFGGAVGGLALAMLSTVSGTAVAQVAPAGACTANGLGGAAQFAPFAAGGALNSLVSAINTANTAFLTQGTAFIGSPPNPQPNQEGGGIWARGIGGDINTKGAVGTAFTLGGAPAGTLNCNASTNLKFTGFQAGTDMARLNWNGWNVHVGATAGYLSATAQDTTAASPALGFGNGTLRTSLEVPFVGVYAAATYGGFFVDGQLRWDFYHARLNDPIVNNLTNQGVDARGIAFTANTGYNVQLGNGWFIEPSAGIVVSKVVVDPILAAGTAQTGTGPSYPNTTKINDIYSTLGRLSIRAGTTIVGDKMIWQPFATVSVYREFAGQPTATYTENSIGGAFPGALVTAAQTGTNVGTYGQVALGIAGQVVGTGWLGYLRGDYRFGEHINGYSLNGGLRYQFTPDPAPMAPKGLITKAPPMMATAYNWTGMYIGANFGANYGWTEWTVTANGNVTKPKFAGALAGGQIGYDWQSGKWVFGVEGMVDWTNARGASPCPGNFFFNCEASQSLYATATARIGYALWDRAIVYLKGGLAVANEKTLFVCNAPSGVVPLAGCPGASDAKTRAGWTIGYGSEFALSRNWTVKSETSYYNLGTARYNLAGFGSSTDVRTHGLTSIIGLNYRFNAASAGPVAARY